MKNLKRTLCLFMAMAMICMLPGMTHIVSAAKVSVSETTQSEVPSALQTDQNVQTQPLQGDLPKSDLSETYQSGILKQNVLSDEERSITLATSSATTTASDMMYALRKVNPVFSSKNNDNESIDLNTGSLNLSYPLANMVGINGMELSLSLIYSSAAANKLDKGYTGDDPKIINGIWEYYYMPVTVEKPISAAEKGLGYGWSFNIPHIRKITKLDDEGNVLDYYKQIILDNGTGLHLDGDNLCDLSITEDNLTKNPILIFGDNDYQYEGITAVFENQAVSHVLSYKDGTKYYFDENDLCVGKEDRFGNKILYTYADGKLTSITDHLGRSIVLTWNVNKVTVTASDGSLVCIVLGGETISSICYNNAETSSFAYVTDEASFGNPALEIPYVLLT